MSQWSHSHGRGQPRCYDSMCGASPEVREETELTMGSAFVSMFSSGLFFLAILFKEPILYGIWILSLLFLVYLFKKIGWEGIIVGSPFHIITIAIYAFLIWVGTA